jgi:hypothetical protein
VERCPRFRPGGRCEIRVNEVASCAGL